MMACIFPSLPLPCPCNTGNPIADSFLAARSAFSRFLNMPTWTNRAPAGISGVAEKGSGPRAALPDFAVPTFAAPPPFRAVFV